MNYIIFDLEWNSAYSHSLHSFMNEIIEIGAVKLDEKLNIVDTYKQLIIPEFTMKLSGRCKRLTNITIEEIKEEGTDFFNAFKLFSAWGKGEDNVFISWSNSDLYVLTQNFLQHTGSAKISFIQNYCDVQKYCMSFVKKEDNPTGNQIALERCAEIFGVDVDKEKLHRALTDCYVTYECMKKVYDKEKFRKFTKHCDVEFFDRLLFKPYAITQEVQGDFDIKNVELFCPDCDGIIDLPDEFTLVNKSFKGAVKCNYCLKHYWVFIRVKRLYDDYSVKTSYVEMNKKRARKIEGKGKPGKSNYKPKNKKKKKVQPSNRNS